MADNKKQEPIKQKWTFQDEMWEWTIALILGFVTGPVLFHFLPFINEPSLKWYEFLLFALFYRLVIRKANLNINKELKEWVEVIVFAVFLVFNIRVFVIQNYEIPSGSMIPTLQLKDRLFATRFSYWNKLPKRGDIIILKFPIAPEISPIGKEKTVFVKRAIAFEGETVEIKNKQVIVNDKPLVEPYKYHSDSAVYPANQALQADKRFTDAMLTHDWKFYSLKKNVNVAEFEVKQKLEYLQYANGRDNMRPIVVPKGYIFAMGDNRDQSYDCRYWGFVPVSNLKAKAWFLYWPFKHARFVK